jgi:hypothetical protein
VLRACAVAEKEGVPAVAIVSTGFLRQATAIARTLGIADMPIAEYPGTILTDSPEERRSKVKEQLAPAVIRGLQATGAGNHGAVVAVAEPAPRDIVFAGDLTEVLDHFEENLWTDGLPVIPPTLDRVEAFMRETDRDPAEVLGVLAPEYREATVWSVAVNGVMAGCRPEYMPVLLGIVDTLADPLFRIQDAGSTPGWEPLVIVSGPLVKRLAFNSGSGLMRVGPRANTSVGRFLRLFLRNVAGLRTPPGTTDKGSIGTTFNVALAEDADAVARTGWTSFGVDRGFAPDDDVVTVQSVYAISPPVYSSGTAEDHLAALSYILGTTAGHWTSMALYWRESHPLLLLNPSVARVLVEAGLSKDDVRQYLYDNTKVEARWVEAWAHHCGVDDSSLENLIARGEAPPEYAESDDPHRLVPVLLRPESVNIVIGGDPGRNQSRFYINNNAQGPPVSRRAETVAGR